MNQGAGIMENISEKPKRGRPRKYEALWMQMLAETWPDLRSTRGLQEAGLMSTTFGTLVRLYDADRVKNSWAEFYIDPKRVHVFHKAIMAALGRIEQKALLVKTAREIATEDLTTAEALSRVRRVRNRLEYLRGQEAMRIVFAEEAGGDPKMTGIL